MKNLTWQNPEQLFVAQELINKVKSKCCGIKVIYFADGEHKTAHYAICTAFMALGMMIPGMAAGWLQDQMGYNHFFIWIMICCAVTFGVTALLKIDPEFGKKKD